MEVRDFVVRQIQVAYLVGSHRERERINDGITREIKGVKTYT